MLVLPAIDLRDGRVVRLSQGDYDRQTVYSDDPVAVAKEFASAGAEWIHVVDLDAAREGRPRNTAAVESIRREVSVRIELGGGARDEGVIEQMLAGGADRVVVGSAAVKDWRWFEGLLARAELAGKLALGLDARDGLLAVHGWTEQSETTADELARHVAGSRLGAIVYTDIARDGMLSGVNVEATSRVIEATDVPVIASGGVGSLDDVRRCREIGCAGVIVGRAWYEGRIDLPTAIAQARGD